MGANTLTTSEETMETRTIVSSKLGEINYTDTDVTTLCAPLLGFPDLNDFLLIANDKSYPFLWFQSVQDKDICFILVEPELFDPEYAPKLNKREFKILGADDEKMLKVFAIVVVPDQPKNSTMNLRAPLIVNVEKKLAKQVILEDDKWQIKTPLFKS